MPKTRSQTKRKSISSVSSVSSERIDFHNKSKNKSKNNSKIRRNTSSINTNTNILPTNLPNINPTQNFFPQKINSKISSKNFVKKSKKMSNNQNTNETEFIEDTEQPPPKSDNNDNNNGDKPTQIPLKQPVKQTKENKNNNDNNNQNKEDVISLDGDLDQDNSDNSNSSNPKRTRSGKKHENAILANSKILYKNIRQLSQIIGKLSRAYNYLCKYYQENDHLDTRDGDKTSGNILLASIIGSLPCHFHVIETFFEKIPLNYYSVILDVIFKNNLTNDQQRKILVGSFMDLMHTRYI